MGKILAAINGWFIKQNMRDDMEYHCAHQPIGSCSEDCAELVRAERSW